MSKLSNSVSNKKGGFDKPAPLKSIFLPLLTLAIGVFIVLLDSTAMNVIVPKLTQEFNSSLSVIQWAVTAYTLALSAVIPLSGWMTERFGVKRIFIICISLFITGSFLCTLSATAGQLIVFRVIQGLGGGMVCPIAVACAYKITPKEKIGIIMGMMGIPILFAPIIASLLSGWLAEYASWKWVFLINIPIGIAAILLGLRALPKFEKKAVHTLDVLGMLLAPLAFSLLVYGVNEGGSNGASPKMLMGLIIGGIALITFILVELRTKEPLLELHIFRLPPFRRGVIIQWIFQLTMNALLFLIPVYLQQAKGYSAFDSGKAMSSLALASAAFMVVGGGLFDKFGVRPLAITGMTAVASGLFMLAFGSNSWGIGMTIIPLVLIGTGFGLCIMPFSTNVLQSAPQNLVDNVNSLTNATQQIIASFAVAGVTALLALMETKYSGNTTGAVSAAAFAYKVNFIVVAVLALCAAVASIRFHSAGSVKKN